MILCMIALIMPEFAMAKNPELPMPPQHDIKVKITAYGLSEWRSVPRMSVADILASERIPFGLEDIIEPEPDQVVRDGEEIFVKQVTYDEVVEEEPIAYPTEEKKDDSLLEGETKVVQEGKDGVEQVTYRRTLAAGEEIDRIARMHVTITEPTPKIIAKGTAKEGKDYDGKEAKVSYSKKYEVEATAYCDGGHTASGRKTSMGIIAVDPKVIPLGTKVFVENYGYAICADTGGAIKGKIIDIWLPSEKACNKWGRRKTTLYILKDQSVTIEKGKLKK